MLGPNTSQAAYYALTLHICPHAAMYVSSYSSVLCMYMCPHSAMCPHTALLYVCVRHGCGCRRVQSAVVRLEPEVRPHSQRQARARGGKLSDLSGGAGVGEQEAAVA